MTSTAAIQIVRDAHLAEINEDIALGRSISLNRFAGAQGVTSWVIGHDSTSLPSDYLAGAIYSDGRSITLDPTDGPYYEGYADELMDLVEAGSREEFDGTETVRVPGAYTLVENA